MTRGMARLALCFAMLSAGAGAAVTAMAAENIRAAFPAQVSQGALVVAKVAPGSRVDYAGRSLSVAGDGAVVFGVGRDEKGPLRVSVRPPQGSSETVTIAVTPRDWPIERVVGVPPSTVKPSPEIAERIRREQARVVAARNRDDARTDFETAFVWPVSGRISGRFGNQRVYVVHGKDVPKSPHSGMDIAAPEGTPIKAPAGGIITFADPGLYLTGGTLLIDHGHGVSSNFLHLSRIDVKVGDRVEQGQVVGAVGHTGRATGPHLHWGMNWFGVRVDPLLVLDPSDALTSSAAVVDLVGPTAVGYLSSTRDAREKGNLTQALREAAACARTGQVELATREVPSGILTLRETGQTDVELVLPQSPGAYLFWPGKKPGVNVAADDTLSLAPALQRAVSDYFGIPGCLHG